MNQLASTPPSASLGSMTASHHHPSALAGASAGGPCRSLSFRGGDSRKRRARALANAIAFDDGPAEEQIIWLQSFLTTEQFNDAIIASVPIMVEEARAAPVDVLVWETQELLLTCSTAKSLKLIQTMFRCSSVTSFPPNQVRRIFSVARMGGMKQKDLTDVTRLIAEEQSVLKHYMGHDPVALGA